MGSALGFLPSLGSSPGLAHDDPGELRRLPTADAWKPIGFNLDGKITTATSKDVCQLVHPCDAVAGAVDGRTPHHETAATRQDREDPSADAGVLPRPEAEAGRNVDGQCRSWGTPFV